MFALRCVGSRRPPEGSPEVPGRPTAGLGELPADSSHESFNIGPLFAFLAPYYRELVFCGPGLRGCTRFRPFFCGPGPRGCTFMAPYYRILAGFLPGRWFLQAGAEDRLLDPFLRSGYLGHLQCSQNVFLVFAWCGVGQEIVDFGPLGRATLDLYRLSAR